MLDAREAVYFYYVGRGCQVCRNCVVSLMGKRPSIKCEVCNSEELRDRLDRDARHVDATGLSALSYTLDVVANCTDIVDHLIAIKVKVYSSRPSSHELCKDICWHHEKATHFLSSNPEGLDFIWTELMYGGIGFVTNAELPSSCDCEERTVKILRRGQIPGTSLYIYELSK